MRNLFVILAVLGLVACGNEGTTEPGTGQIRVQVQGVGTGTGPAPADIDSIVVTAVDAGDQSHTIDMASDTSGTWTGESGRLYTGTYQVSAQALSAAGDVLFASDETEVEVLHDQSVTVILVMNQQGAAGEHEMPVINSVVLDRWQVEQDDPIQVTVHAEGGVGSLELTGRHALSATSPGTFNPGTGVELVDGSATFDWVAPKVAGPAWFVVTVTDDEGNASELGITVWVGQDYGFLDFEATFNIAPTVSLTSRVLNEGGAATFYFENVVADDPENHGGIQYTWTSDCDVTWSDEQYYEGPTGVFQDGGPAVTFKAQLVGVDRPETCIFTLEATDTFVQGSESVEGATSTLIVHLQASEATNLFQAVFEQDFGTDGDFLVSDTATGNGMFAWTRGGGAETNITAPIAYFLHKAGYVELAEEAFEDMRLRASATPLTHDDVDRMDIGVLLYAFEVTGDPEFKVAAEAAWPVWKSDTGYPGDGIDPLSAGMRLQQWGGDASYIALSGFMAQKHGLVDGGVSASDDWAAFTALYEAHVADIVQADPYFLPWTNYVALEFGLGTHDASYDLLAASSNPNVQRIAYAVMGQSIDPARAFELLFAKLPNVQYSQYSAEGMAALQYLFQPAP